ncbi:signal peptidase I, partial [bacterium]|nr:signal peptidase I [bacterium]
MARKSREKSKLREYFEVIVVSIGLALLVRTFIVGAFRIPTGSMEDTLLVGDFFLANRFIYRFTDPKPGDVIVFKYPLDPRSDFVKRCVAVEGQTVQIKDKVLYVDGKQIENPCQSKFIDPRIYQAGLSTRDNFGPVRVPAGHLFMMGDNRDNSRDSRYWGFLDKRFIKGRAFMLYFSWEQLPGDPKLARREGPFLLALPKFVFSFVKVLAFDIVRAPWRVRWSR